MQNPSIVRRQEALQRMLPTYPGWIIKPVLNTTGPLVNGMLLDGRKHLFILSDTIVSRGGTENLNLQAAI